MAVDRSHAAAVMRPRLAEALLRVVIAAALAYSGYVHWHLHRSYDGNRTSVLSQGDLFLAQAALCLVTAVLVLAIWAGPRIPRALSGLVVALAVVVAAGSLAAVLVYRYVNVGRIGIVPDMYEPAWYGDKTRSAVAEAVATVAAVFLLAVVLWRARHSLAATGGDTHSSVARRRVGSGM